MMAIMSTSQAGGVDLSTTANPSSTRTSITHVENEEEARPQRPITIETPVIPTTTTSNPTTPVAQLPLPVHEEGRLVSSSSSSIQTLEPSSYRKNAVPVMAAVVPQPEADVEIPQTPQVYVTFLVISGKRRTLAFDPCTTIARVKELAWNSWPSGACPRI